MVSTARLVDKRDIFSGHRLPVLVAEPRKLQPVLAEDVQDCVAEATNRQASCNRQAAISVIRSPSPCLASRKALQTGWLLWQNPSGWEMLCMEVPCSVPFRSTRGSPPAMPDDGCHVVVGQPGG